MRKPKEFTVRSTKINEYVKNERAAVLPVNAVPHLRVRLESGGDVYFVGAVAQSRDQTATLESIDDLGWQGSGDDEEYIAVDGVFEDVVDAIGLDLTALETVVTQVFIFCGLYRVGNGIQSQKAGFRGTSAVFALRTHGGEYSDCRLHRQDLKGRQGDCGD